MVVSHICTCSNLPRFVEDESLPGFKSGEGVCVARLNVYQGSEFNRDEGLLLIGKGM